MTQSAHNTRLEITESMRHTQPHHHISTDSWHNCGLGNTHTHTLIRSPHSRLLFQTHPPSPSQHAGFNQLTFISLPCFSMGLYGAFSHLHKRHLCPAPSPVWESEWRGEDFFFFLHCLGVFNGHNSEDSKHLPRWFVYYVNQLVIRGVEGVITFYSQTSLMY